MQEGFGAMLRSIASQDQGDIGMRDLFRMLATAYLSALGEGMSLEQAGVFIQHLFIGMIQANQLGGDA